MSSIASLAAFWASPRDVADANRWLQKKERPLFRIDPINENYLPGRVQAQSAGPNIAANAGTRRGAHIIGVPTPARRISD